MIYYYAALVISYMLNDHTTKAVVWFDRERHCQEAMDKRLGDPIYNHLYELYGTDIMMTCEVTDKVSFVLRPKLRPEGE